MNVCKKRRLFDIIIRDKKNACLNMTCLLDRRKFFIYVANKYFVLRRLKTVLLCEVYATNFAV